MRIHKPTLHEIRVAASLAAPHDGYNRMVALHHDAVEDGHITLGELALQHGESFAKTIDHLTRRDGEEYARYIGRIIESGDIVALIVKRQDILDHLMQKETLKNSLGARYTKALVRIEEALRNGR